MKQRYIYIAATVALVAVAIGSILYLRHNAHTTSPLFPASITKQVSFVTLVPGSAWSIDSSHAVFSFGVLSFKSVSQGVTLSVTEQATPDVFMDVPEYYPNLLTRLHSYATIGSANGTAYLTKPTELAGAQQAVLNANGTLLFAHPSKDISTDNWRRFFNTLQLIKPN